MKPRPPRVLTLRIPLVLCCILAHICFGSTPPGKEDAPDENYAARWAVVIALGKQGLTQSALDSTLHIYEDARAAHNVAQTIAALLHAMNTIAAGKEDGLIQAWGLVNKEIAAAESPVVQVMHSLRGECLRTYYTRNRWQHSTRSRMTGPDSADITTWDARTLLEKMIEEYSLSLRDADSLKKTRIGILDPIITAAGQEGSRLRPTLYDLVAHRALDALLSNADDLTQPEFQFTVNEARYFSPANEFARLSITTRDSASLRLHALRVLQDLIAFHSGEESPDVLIDADLKRLDLMREFAALPNKDSLYLSALQSLEKRFPKSPLTAEISLRIAALYHRWAVTCQRGVDERYRWMDRKALEVCDRTLRDHPESYGAKLCARLAAEIRSKSVSFTVDDANAPGAPFKALVNYRNANTFFWRIVPTTIEKYRALRDSRNRDSTFRSLTMTKPLREWKTTFPDPGDFQDHSVETAVSGLTVGQYIILVATDPSFTTAGQAVGQAFVQISAINYVVRAQRDGSHEFVVLNRMSGTPMQGVTVRVCTQEYDNRTGVARDVKPREFVTNVNGRALVPRTNDPFVQLTVELIKGPDRLGADEMVSFSGAREVETTPRTHFFLDRAIYRPGQTVYFKGIMLRAGDDASSIVEGEKTTVRFISANGQEISRQVLTSNKFGSIHGTFIAPSASVNGRMHIANEHGSAWFSVEDYKRPTFEVSVDSVRGTPRLGDVVRVHGQAKAYTGAVIDHAQVKYRVVRTARFPDWWCRSGEQLESPEVWIADGEATTDDTGGLVLTFKAIPDLAVPRSDQPVFTYQVSVDVTDQNGETRSGERRVGVGYASRTLSVAVPATMNRDSILSFPIHTENLNGVHEAASGELSVYRLQPPSRVLRERNWEAPDISAMSKATHDSLFPGDAYGDERRMRSWPRGSKVCALSFNTRTNGRADLSALRKAPQGAYVMEAVSRDKKGQEVKDTRFFTLYSTQERSLPYAMTDWVVAVKILCEPGDEAVILVGSGYRKVKMLYDVECKGVIVKSAWMEVDSGQKTISLPIEERYRGNVSVHVTFAHDNRIYARTVTVVVPWTNKELHLSFETFRSNLSPGAQDEWRLRVAGPGKDVVAAEMVATLYDASLDAFVRHGWSVPSVYPTRSALLDFNSRDSYNPVLSDVLDWTWNPRFSAIPWRVYPEMYCWFGMGIAGWPGHRQEGPIDLIGGLTEAGEAGRMRASRARYMYSRAMRSTASSLDVVKALPRIRRPWDGYVGGCGAGGRSYGIGFGAGGGGRDLGSLMGGEGSADGEPDPSPGLSTIPTRVNVNETAFFYPELTTDDNGDILITFQVPEALTRWRMLGLAHTRDLKFGSIEKEFVTQKQLMVTPNPPRFFRENDRITFTAKVSNISDTTLSGTAQLTLFDAATMKPVDAVFMNVKPTIPFTAQRGQSAALSWDLTVPEDLGAVTCKVVARAGDFTDGEERTVLILTNRILVTESMPLPIRKKGTRKFSFDKLISQNSGSSTLRNHKLTLEFTPNPAWYAIQALPYLMEYPHECAEQTFGRFYANTIAASIANAGPWIKAVFDTWRTEQPGALVSALEKNQSLKSLVLEETPWLLDGKDESERIKRVALLFDLTRMANERGRMLAKLIKTQLPDGAWPWFAGMPGDRYITQYILTGLGRLDHLKMLDVRADPELRQATAKCISYLDNSIKKDYDDILKRGQQSVDSNHIDETHIQYLYSRSYFKDIPTPGNYRTAVDYFTAQAGKHWLSQSLSMQGMIALALSRSGDPATAAAIMRSLKENAIVSDEIGMYWKEMYEESGYWWYQAPIESQAMMVEAFDEVTHDTAAVEDLKAWLLKSKQTQDWGTTKATAEACYALLLRRTKWLDRPSTVKIALGDVTVDAAKVEAGTSYFSTSWAGPNVKPSMGVITITKPERGVAWGAAYWQYFEQLDKITPHATPLRLDKKLLLRQNSPTGPVITPVNEKTALKPGDKLTVRIELRVDRDLEYVHMKDMRASGFEPINVLSGIREQDGLSYYESTRDAATNFFFASLRKGTYVFEYPLVVSHVGDFSTGITTIQCMYAPEFTSHSVGVRVRVGR